ncbi:MAG: dUTP diphosphatase [Microgenomates group bacterium]
MVATLKFKKLHNDAVVPKYDHPDDAGFGIYSTEEKFLKPMEYYAIATGISSEIPNDYFVSFRDRSSMAVKGLHVMGGVIDAGYRGEWKVILINLSGVDYKIEVGDKIAQGILQSAKQAKIEIVEDLSDTSRGEGGFGSTGR